MNVIKRSVERVMNQMELRGYIRPVVMSTSEVRAYFEVRLKKGNLVAGSNFMVDADGAVHRCVVWASGGIWHIMSFPKGHPDYKEIYLEATKRRDTQFKKGRKL